MSSIEKRIEKLENHSMVKQQRHTMLVYAVYYEADLVPDVFDRPLTEWETYKQLSGELQFLNVDPVAEAKARGGDIPTCPASRYEEWKHRQNEALGIKKSVDLMMFNHSLITKDEHNGTKPDR